MTAAPWQQRPESKGYVRIRSADPFEQPEIQPRYLTEETDRRVLVAAMRLARRLLQVEAARALLRLRGFPRADKVQSDDEMLAAAKERGTTTFHPMGTCRMGPENDPTSVVDDELRVRGLEGLRVVDASIMPMMLSANINAGIDDDRRQGLRPHSRQGAAAADHPDAVNRRLRPTGLMASGHLIAS